MPSSRRHGAVAGTLPSSSDVEAAALEAEVGVSRKTSDKMEKARVRRRGWLGTLVRAGALTALVGLMAVAVLRQREGEEGRRSALPLVSREKMAQWRSEAAAWKAVARSRLAMRTPSIKTNDGRVEEDGARADEPDMTASDGQAQAPKSNDVTSRPVPESDRNTVKTVSVVLPCAGENELMVMTAKSFFENTPPDVLHEVVVVDDGSDPPLETFWPVSDFRGTDAATWAEVRKKVRFHRHDHTIGLMNARTTGANAATGDAIAVYDCHVKPDPSWWTHTLRELNVNRKRVVIPTITSLDIDTWEEQMHLRPKKGHGMASCYLAWDSEFKWFNNRFHDATKPRWVPMMSGGLFAMTKSWWDDLGGYDSEMTGWGGENIEQSLRIWLCGGEITHAEEAYIAHMWRTHDRKTRANYHINGDVHRNRWRAVHGWLGDFENATLQYPDFRRFSGVNGQRQDMHEYDDAKRRLQCKTFDAYVDFFEDIYLKAGVLPGELFHLESLERPGLCLDRSDGKPEAVMLGNAKMPEGPLGLRDCGAAPMQQWHVGNRKDDGECCSGLRGMLSDQCVAIRGGGMRTAVCSIDGSDRSQKAELVDIGGDAVEVRLQGDRCLLATRDGVSLGPCGGSSAQWRRTDVHLSVERTIYDEHKARRPPA